MKTFQRGPLSFEVIDRGDKNGTPIILLHGFPQFAEAWGKVIPLLTKHGYRCIAPNQRGYSPKARPIGRRAYRPEQLVKDILVLIDRSGAEKVHLVGHDWGAFVAWLVADKAPDRISSLTAISVPHPRAFMQSLFRSRQFLLSWYMVFFQIPRLPEIVLLSRGGEKALVRTGLGKMQARTYMRHFIKDPSTLTAALAWYRALLLGLRAYRAGVIRVPTLFVWSSSDIAVSRKAAELTAQWIRAPYTFQVLSGASHWIPEQKSETLAELILKHIGKK